MSNETKIEVEDVASYIKYINELSPTIDGDAKTYESTFVFRGQGSTKFDLVPSIGRDSLWRKPGSDAITPIKAPLSTRRILLKPPAAYCQMFLNEICFRLIF